MSGALDRDSVLGFKYLSTSVPTFSNGFFSLKIEIHNVVNLWDKNAYSKQCPNWAIFEQ
jgi:hypothetical protein